MPTHGTLTVCNYQLCVKSHLTVLICMKEILDRTNISYANANNFNKYMSSIIQKLCQVSVNIP